MLPKRIRNSQSKIQYFVNFISYSGSPKVAVEAPNSTMDVSSVFISKFDSSLGPLPFVIFRKKSEVLKKEAAN